MFLLSYNIPRLLSQEEKSVQLDLKEREIQNNEQKNINITEPTIKKESEITDKSKNLEFILEPEDLSPIEIERTGEKKRSASDDKKTRRSKSVPHQPMHPTIFSLLEDEDEEISHTSEDLQSKTFPLKLPTIS